MYTSIKRYMRIWFVMLVVMGVAPRLAMAERVVVGLDPTSPPFELTREHSDEPVGFDVDLIKAMAKAQDMDISIKVLPFSGLVPSLLTGGIDVAFSGITITRERMQKVLFSDAYYRSGLSVMVREDSSISGFDDLDGHLVGTQKSTSSVSYLQNHGMDDKHIKQYPNIVYAYQALKAGGVDAVFYDHPINMDYIKQHKGFRSVGDLLNGEYLGIAITKDRPELQSQLNDGLAKIRDSGEYAAIYARWFGRDGSGLVTKVIKPADVATDN